MTDWLGIARARENPSCPHRNRKSQTRCWRGLDSNFQYAGAVNLVVAPFMPPKARDGPVRSLSFRTARRPASKRRGPDRRGRNPCRRGWALAAAGFAAVLIFATSSGLLAAGTGSRRRRPTFVSHGPCAAPPLAPAKGYARARRPGHG